MTIEVLKDPESLAARAADFIAQALLEKPDLSVLVATGNTPMRTYAELERRTRTGELDFSSATAVQLDEYLNVPDHDSRSLFGWMQRSFTVPLGISKIIRFDPSLDPVAACARYEADIARAGGIDLAVLGLGPNGHLGFNEPPSGPDAPTRALELTPASLTSNAAYWGELEVPARALTAGMDLILSSSRILLLVSGTAKRDILARALKGPQTPEVPASYLGNANLTVLADEEAARGLNL